MNPKDKQELDEYRKLGTVDEIRRRLENPFPAPGEGYAPMPLEDDEKQYSGLIEDEDYDPDWEEK